MSEITSAFEKLVELSKELEKVRYAGIQYIVFLDDLVENPSRWEKYKSSQSQNVFGVITCAIEDALLLWNARNWDSGGDAVSVHNAICQIKRIETEIKDWNIRAGIDLSFEDIPRDWQSDLAAIVSQDTSNKIRNEIRVIRTERHAHRLITSGDRKKLPEGYEFSATLGDLLDQAKLTIDLIDKISYVLKRTDRSFEGSALQFRDDCQTFWNAMPVFRDVELSNEPNEIASGAPSFRG